jgi:hypothetical protein
VNRFALGLVVVAICGLTAFFIVPAHAGTWPPVPSDCQYSEGDVLLSGDAFDSVHCTDEELKGVLRCFHYPYRADRKETVHTLFAALAVDVLLQKHDLLEIADAMEHTSPSIFACKLNDIFWIETNWKKLI